MVFLPRPRLSLKLTSVYPIVYAQKANNPQNHNRIYFTEKSDTMALDTGAEYLASRSVLKYPECFSQMSVTFPHSQHGLKGVYRVLKGARYIVIGLRLTPLDASPLFFRKANPEAHCFCTVDTQLPQNQAR